MSMDPSHPTRLPPLQGSIHSLHPHSFPSHHQGSSLPHLGAGYYSGSPVSPTSATATGHPQQHFYPPPPNNQSTQYSSYPPIPQSPSSAHRPLDPSLQGPEPISKGRKRKEPAQSASPALGPPPGSAGSGIVPLAGATNTPPPPTGQSATAGLLGVGQNSEDEPLYVNAKQYHRILKRRAARAKLEEGNKGNKNKKVNTLPYPSLYSCCCWTILIPAVSS